MKILHILRSEPEDATRRLLKGVSQGESSTEVPLYKGPVDYAKLVAVIYEADRVICWW